MTYPYSRNSVMTAGKLVEETYAGMSNTLRMMMQQVPGIK